jgi:hypothetical protein
MPLVSRFMIKSAFAWLLLALIGGAAIAAWPVPGDFWPGAAARAAVVHLLTVGWLTQLIFGVAHWLFPRYSRERPHGAVWLVWTAFAGLNLGVAGRLLGSNAAWGEIIGGGLQFVGILAITAALWPRIRLK